jgi:hypothetical protein
MEFINLAFGQGDQFDAGKRELLVEAGMGCGCWIYAVARRKTTSTH